MLIFIVEFKINNIKIHTSLQKNVGWIRITPWSAREVRVKYSPAMHRVNKIELN